MCVLGALISMVFAFAQEKKSVDVMFTHDVHSFLDRIAQAKTLIDEQTAKNPETLILDAGDFSQGTLYQAVFATEAAEMQILGMIGVEATTMGNHEYDCGAKGLAGMFDASRAARERGQKIPQFLLCNADWSNQNEYTKIVKRAYDDFGGKDYAIFMKNGVKIAVFGLFGKDALFCAPTCEMTFIDQYEVAAKTVKEIKEKENPDMIVCISHGGTDKNAKKSEDEILAKKVPEIDLIISGHSHTKLDEPIRHGDTYIVSCKSYAIYLGSLTMTQKKNGRWEVSRYEIIPTEGVTPNAAVRAKLDSFKKGIDKAYMSKFGLKSEQVLAKGAKAYPHQEMGHIIADMYRKSVSKYEIANDNAKNMGTGTHIDLAVVPTGVAREDWKKLDITAEDVFNCFSLGIGPDMIAGYPLVSVYLSGREFKNACEIDCSMGNTLGVSLLRLFFSGITYEYNPHRLVLDKVTHVYLVKEDGTKEEVQDDKLYRVVSDIYTGKMLASVNDLTKGLLSLIPKNSDGSVIENLEDNIIRVNLFEGTTEFKAWAAIAEGVKMTGKIEDYEPVVEAAYTKVPSRNLGKIMSNPSKFAGIVYGIIFGLIGVIALIVVLCVCLKKRRK